MDKFLKLSTLKKEIFTKVMKCQLQETSDIVVVKQYKKTEYFAPAKLMAFRELRLMRKLDHENILKLLEVFEEEHNLYYVFEYVSCSLCDLLNETIPYHLKRGFALQITRALTYLHRLNIVHGGMRPKNIMVTDNDVIKLRDFHNAKYQMPEEHPSINYSSNVWYKSPELLLPGSCYNSAVDIWALGCIIMEIETDEPLFPGDSTYQQLSLIIRLCGLLTEEQNELLNQEIKLRTDAKDIYVVEKLFKFEPLFSLIYSLTCKYPYCDKRAISFANLCLRMDPNDRLPAIDLLNHDYFTDDDFCENYLQDLLIKANEHHKKVYLLQNHMRHIKTNKMEVLREGPEKMVKFEVVEEKIVKKVNIPPCGEKIEEEEVEEEQQLEDYKLILELNEEKEKDKSDEEKEEDRNDEEKLSYEDIFIGKFPEGENEEEESYFYKIEEEEEQNKFIGKPCQCNQYKTRMAEDLQEEEDEEVQEDESEGLEKTTQLDEESDLIPLDDEDFLWLFDDQNDEIDRMIDEEKAIYWEKERLLEEEEVVPVVKECPRCKYFKKLRAKRRLERMKSKPPKPPKRAKCMIKKKQPSPEPPKLPDEPCVAKNIVHYKRDMIPLTMTVYSGKKLMTEEEARNKACLMERIKKPGFDDICTTEMFLTSNVPKKNEDGGINGEPTKSKEESIDCDTGREEILLCREKMEDYIRRGVNPEFQ